MKIVEHENTLIFKPGTWVKSKFPHVFYGTGRCKIERYLPYCTPYQQNQCRCRTKGVILEDSNGNSWCLYANTYAANNFHVPLGTLMWEKVDEDS